jgi:hypothetical protein
MGSSNEPVTQCSRILDGIFEEEQCMNISDEGCVRVRTDVWLQIGEDPPIKVQTRKLCRDGVFLEFTGPVAVRTVEVIFPDGGDPALTGNNHISGSVFYRWPDGIWIAFDRCLRSVSELLMRNSLALPPAAAHRASQANAWPKALTDRSGC